MADFDGTLNQTSPQIGGLVKTTEDHNGFIHPLEHLQGEHVKTIDDFFGVALENKEQTPFPRFTMRAFKTTVPTGFIYWDVLFQPDVNALQAPVPAGDLTDVVIARVLRVGSG